MNRKNKKAAVLITVLWIITILTALCVSVAHRSAVILKLSSYQMDKTKSYSITRAGTYRALALVKYKRENKISQGVDAISEKWANDPEAFKEHSFAGGFYTLSYAAPVAGAQFLYGLSDESSRLNINKAPAVVLSRLIMDVCGIDIEEAEKIAYCIEDWRDENSEIGVNAATGKMLGAEDEYYKNTENPYPCKNSDFEIIEEVFLVKGMTPEIFNKLKNFITIYTNGSVNINTAPPQVLSALFGEDFPDLADKISVYRQGRDDKIGTKDDRWFSSGPYIVQRGEEGMVEVKNLDDGDWLNNTCGITTQEYSKIKKLVPGQGIRLVASSDLYRVCAKGEFKKVISNIEAVYEFKQNEKSPVIKFYNAE
ncbi:MAG: general secretion pathway protein GspK [Candidatus Omnitrophica bacterium]|nr:general secretion pathway protein GspK [Candidatus Omnitrophota bacterium]